jgi:hypothetical protein
MEKTDALLKSDPPQATWEVADRASRREQLYYQVATNPRAAQIFVQSRIDAAA